VKGRARVKGHDPGEAESAHQEVVTRFMRAYHKLNMCSSAPHVVRPFFLGTPHNEAALMPRDAS